MDAGCESRALPPRRRADHDGREPAKRRVRCLARGERPGPCGKKAGDSRAAREAAEVSACPQSLLRKVRCHAHTRVGMSANSGMAKQAWPWHPSLGHGTRPSDQVCGSATNVPAHPPAGAAEKHPTSVHPCTCVRSSVRGQLAGKGDESLRNSQPVGFPSTLPVRTSLTRAWARQKRRPVAVDRHSCSRARRTDNSRYLPPNFQFTWSGPPNAASAISS